MKELIKIGIVCGIVIVFFLSVFAPAVINIGSSDEGRADEAIDQPDEQGKKNNEDNDIKVDIDDIRDIYGFLNSLGSQNTGSESNEKQDNNNNNDPEMSGHSDDDNAQSPGYNEHNLPGGDTVMDDSHGSSDEKDDNNYASSTDDAQDPEGDDTIFASSIIVDDDGDGDYLTIQAAIDAATPGDTIYVWGGVYYEDVKVNKTVSLIGNGTSATFVVGSGTNTVMFITADWVQMTGFRINGSGSSIYFKSGMSIYGSDNVTIDQCDISNNNNGIFVRNCSHLKLTNNTCSYTNRYGIYLEHVSNSEVYANICNYNVFDGIKYIGVSWNNLIEKNKCLDNDRYGIQIYSSNSVNNMIKENNCSLNNDSGIRLFSSNIKVIKNVCIKNTYGVRMALASSNIIDNNNCINNTYGIYALLSEEITIVNNSCNDGTTGIIFLSSSNNTIRDNECLSNRDYGIDSEYSSHGNYVTHNKCNNNYIGIRLYSSSYEEIINNTCSYNNFNGIYTHLSTNNSIHANKCMNNYMSGIRINYLNGNSIKENYCHSNGGTGIYLGWSSENTIERNTCNSNSNDGICFWIGNNNTVNDNDIIDNGIGVYLHNSYNNMIHHNKILDNFWQLYNVTSTNTWDDGDGEGNWWSDYNGTDDGSGGRTADDGVGDTWLPHQGVDYYPLMISSTVNTTEAEEDTEDLIADVEDLSLPSGTENSLTKKLENAIKSMEKGNIEAAINKLEAFIHEVEAQRGKKITDSDADALIAAAEAIIAELEAL